MSASDVVATLALALSVGSTVISVFALRLERRNLSVTTYHSATELALELDRLFIANPHLRPLFYDGAEPDGHDRNLVLASCELVLDVLECLWDRERDFMGPDRAAWRSYVLDMLAGGPELARFYDARPGWYPSLQRLLAEDGMASAVALGEARRADPA